MRFHSKYDFAPPAILLGLLHCPWTWGISSQPLQHLPSYWSFSNLGHGVSPHGWFSDVQPPAPVLGRGISIHGCSSEAQTLLLTLDVRYLLMAAAPELGHGVSPHSHSTTYCLTGFSLTLDVGYLFLATSAPHSCCSSAYHLSGTSLPLHVGYLLTFASVPCSCHFNTSCKYSKNQLLKTVELYT